MLNKVSELCCSHCNIQTSGRLRQVSKSLQNGGPQQYNKYRRDLLIKLNVIQKQLDKYTKQLRKISKQERTIYNKEVGFKHPKRIHPKIKKLENNRSEIYRLRNMKRKKRLQILKKIQQSIENTESNNSIGSSNASSNVSSASSCNSNCSGCLRFQ